MFKKEKRDTSLCEHDAAQDMLAAERGLLQLYAAAAGEEGPAEGQALLVRLFGEAAEDARTARAWVRAAGGCFPAAERAARAQAAQRFGKAYKDIAREDG